MGVSYRWGCLIDGKIRYFLTVSSKHKDIPVAMAYEWAEGPYASTTALELVDLRSAGMNAICEHDS